jgi:hypothetical protein
VARSFDGTDDYIQVSPGVVTTCTANRTFVAIIRRAATGWDGIVSLNTAADHGAAMGFEDPSTLILRIDGGAAYSGSSITVPTTDGWVLIASGKDTGTVVPRLHKYVYSTNAWSHANGTTSIGNGSYGTTDHITLGAHTNGSDSLNGDIAVAGIFPGNLTDTQVETLASSLPAWLSLAPQALWLLDQSATTQKVGDLTGNGANQTFLSATTVATSSVPVFNLGHPLVGWSYQELLAPLETRIFGQLQVG